MKRELEQLTEGEERIMQALWSLGEGSVNDVLAVLPAPKPKYTTVATFIKLLGNKGYVTHRAEGKSYIFTPAVSRDDYVRKRMRTMLQNYFDGSFTRMVSFFSEHENLTTQEMDEIQKLMEEIRQKQ